MTRKFKIDVRTDAYAMVIVEAPTAETAVEYLRDNLDGYSLNWRVDDGNAELDVVHSTQAGKLIGVHLLTDSDPEFDESVDYCVDLEWLTENGYEITVKKIDNVERN